MLLEVQKLSVRRSGRLLFREVSATLEAGDALCVTGANGSGKSSLLRALAGLLRVQEGRVTWEGRPFGESDRSPLFHYLSHQDALKGDLTPSEMLSYWNVLAGRASAPFHLGRMFGLDGLLDRPCRLLSAGQRRRLGLARLTLADAPLWLLDEPTTSLDSGGCVLLTGLIADHRAKGGVAVIATHGGFQVPDALRLHLGGAL